MLFNDLTISTDAGAFVGKHPAPELVRALEVTLGGVVIERVLDKVLLQKQIIAVRFVNGVVLLPYVAGSKSGFYVFAHWQEGGIDHVGYVAFSKHLGARDLYQFALKDETECLRFWEICRGKQAVSNGGRFRLDISVIDDRWKRVRRPLDSAIFELKSARRDYGLSVLLIEQTGAALAEFQSHDYATTDIYYYNVFHHYISQANTDAVAWGVQALARKVIAEQRFTNLGGITN